MTLRALFLAVTVLLALSAGPAATAQGIPCSYQAQRIIGPDCDLLGPAHVIAVGISPNGRYVCGYWFCAGGADRPFVWIAPDVFGEPGTFITINLPGFVMGYAQDVNDHGIVVGHVGSSSANFGFVYDLHSGNHTFLPAIDPDGLCWANAINNSNTVCGFRSIGSKGDPVNPQTAFIWNAKDGFTDLGLMNGHSTFGVDITNGGTVAGETGSIDAIAVPFVWNRNGFVEGPTLAGFQTRPQAIGEDGTVVGWGAITPGFGPETRAFAWLKETMTNLGTLPGFDRSVAIDLNATTIVGNAGIITAGGGTAVVWINGEIRRMQTMTPSSPIDFSSASGISHNGMVCAVGHVGSTNEIASALLAPIVIVGDLDGDCRVGIDDLLAVIGAWGLHAFPSPADLNGDGTVVLDLAIVIDQWNLGT